MTVAVDTSVAVPLLVRSHHDHADVVRWWNGQEIALSGHALVETYSVLTRLPGDARLSRPGMLGHEAPMTRSVSR